MSLYFKETPEFFDNAMTSIWCDQKNKPNEIILVLDGPLGQELQYCVNSWQKRLFSILRVFPLKNNVGLGKALNFGLEHCSNEWVFRMDTDDICTPDRFQKQVEFISNNPDIVVFGGQILEFEQTINDAKVLKAVPTKHEEIKQFAQSRCPFNHMTVAYKKDIILQLGGYKHHLFMEDYNLWLRVLGASYQVGNLSEVILHARVGNGMHARRKGLEYIKSEHQLLNLKKELKLQNPIHANMLFLVRSVFRLVPSSVLGKFYNTFLRKKVHK